MDFEQQRRRIVELLEREGYITNEDVKRAMLKVPREEFVVEEYKDLAYSNTPLPIPGGVTISAEHMHAIYLSNLELKPGDKVLEIGAGSGILLAYMKEIVGKKGEVYGVEIIPETYEFAKRNLMKTGYLNKVKLFLGNGCRGLPEFAPFDKIACSAAASKIHEEWKRQLKLGGILLTPLKTKYGQELIRLKKVGEDEYEQEMICPVIFVDLVET